MPRHPRCPQCRHTLKVHTHRGTPGCAYCPCPHVVTPEQYAALFTALNHPPAPARAR